MSEKIPVLLEIAQRTQNWESFLATFSKQSQLILVGIGNKAQSAQDVSRKIMSPERSVSSVMSKLRRLDILQHCERGYYKVADKNFATYLELLMIEISPDHAAIEAEKVAYRALVPLFESLEHQNLIHGNGHHMAQKIAQQAKEMVLDRWIKKDPVT